ncbi:MAG: sulfatase family protein, partial [Anaerolineae bacterium]
MSQQSTLRPNVLFIMSDQHRWDYFGAAGAAFVRTPNLDRIAERGVRFTQCTTNSPVCAPARIGLATGLQPVRLGALDNSAYLPNSASTYYQRLRDDGYRVGCVGKLDLAKPDGYNGRYGDRPCVYAWGFTHPEECEGKMHAGRSPTPRGPYGFYLQERGLYQAFHEDYAARAAGGWVKDAARDSVLPTDAFEDAYIGRRAAEWIETIPDDFPWHYFVSFVGPHNPFDPPTEYAERYRDAPMPPAIDDTMEGKPGAVKKKTRGLTPEQVAVTRRQYCAAIELIDDQIGRMIEALEARGMLDNTYIVYSADHGEMLGDHGLYTKSVPYEAALRVPLLIAGPGIEGGRVSDALVELIDVNPTICDLAGLPTQSGIDARSLASILRAQSTAHRTETVSAIRHFRCIRTERYKYIQNYNALDELYDLE